MRIGEYVKDKGIFLIANFMCFLIIAMVLYILSASVPFIIVLFAAWFVPLMIYILLEGFKMKKYYDNIEHLVESLDKSYLLPEVMEDAEFIEAKKLKEILTDVSRSMHENVKYYKDKECEYREYMEAWIHEIKSPIASTKLIIENNKNEVTSKIDWQIDKIENYIEQVLYYARSSEVNKDFIIKEVNLRDVVNNVLKRNYREFIYKRIRVETKDIDEVVYSDSKWIEFIVNQVAVNSLKYSKDDNGFIKFYINKYENSTVLVIQDNGVGISEKDIDRVFDKGFTGENGRLYGKSTGMGLYLCKKLCEKLDISINIESNVGSGTKIYFGFGVHRELNEIK